MKRLVFGDGPPDAKICFVGEAPGATEEKLGRPFVGSAGDLLWKLAGQVGIVRHECFVTNVVKERPPNNDISVFIQFNKTGPPSCTREYMDYENSLYHELSKLKANVFVPLGNVPLWALLRRYGGNRGLGGGGITKVRGSIFQGQIPPNTGRPVKIIPSIHTAAALPDRTFMFSYMIAADLKRVKVESESPLVQLPSRKLIISPSFYETMEYIRTAQQTDMVGLDIEVMNEEISCMSLSLNPFDSMSIPFTHGGREYFTIEQEVAIMREVAILLSDPTKSIVGQNHIGFDLAFLLRRYRIICRRKVEDIMVAQGIAYPDLPKGLDFTTSIYTREPYYKDEGKKWFKFGGSEEDFRIYNAKDSAVLPEILPIIRGELNRQGNLYHYEQQCLLQGPLSYMHERGMRVDNEGLRQAVVDSENEIAPLMKRFHEICGKPINPSSPAQLCRYFYQDKGIKPYVNRKTKAPTTDETALKRLARRGFEEAGILLKIRSINKLKGTYYEMQMDRDGRLRCSFNPVGTVSTRLSSSKTIFGTGGNTQNLPDAFLKFVLADEDNMFYSFDLEQAENRIVAYIAPEPNMIEAFEQGKDLHRRTASPIFGKHEDLISDVPGSASIGGGTHSERFWGKKCVVGDTEILTPEGWIPIANWNYKHTQIAQWDSRTSTISFVTASNMSVYTSPVIELSSRNAHVVGSPNHKVPLRRSDKGIFKSIPLALVDNDPHYGIPTCGTFKSDISLLTSDEVRLLVAFQADGSYNYNSHRFLLKKERKISRVRTLLSSLGIDYNESKHTDGRTLIGFKGPSWLTKEFTANLLYLSQKEMSAFVEELSLWDGHRKDNGGMQYFSTNPNNVKWAQTLAHLSGYTALISKRPPTGYGKKPLYTLQYNGRVQNATLISCTKRYIDKPELVFGPEVPSGFFLIRSNGIISVTGNSNHELNYDMGYKTFALICEISDREGKLIWDQFHAMYPGVHQYHAWVREKLAKNGRMLENLLGLRRVFLGKWGDELFKEAYSWTPQSSVAQIINHRGLNHIYYNQDTYRPVDLLNQVHDSIVLQMSVKQFTFAQHADCVMRIRESLEQPLTWAGREFVIPVGLKVGLSLDVEKERKVKLREFSSAEELGRRLCELYRDLRGTGVV